MEVSGKRDLKGQSKVLCQPCEDRDSSTQAEGLCTQCEEHMCKTCFDTHKQFKLNRGHTLSGTDVSMITKPRKDDLEKCDQHLNEPIKFYCPEHGQVGCGDCMVLGHKACKVEYIRDIAKTFKDSREFKELTKGAEKCQTEAKQVATSIAKNKKQAKDIKDKFINDVQKFCDSIISKINELKCSVIKQAESMKAKDTDNLDNLEKENEEFMKQMTGFMALFESQIDQPNKLFVTYVQEKAKLKRLQETYEGIRKNNSIKNYQFKPDANLARAVNECKELGSVQQMEKDADVKDVHVPDRVASKASAQSKQVVAAPQEQLLIENKVTCRNIAIYGDYLSYDGNGTDVGLYAYIPYDWKNYYFEVEIVNTGQRGEIVIGVVPYDYPKNLPPGYGDESVGYNTNDGKLYHGSSKGKQFGPKCKTGDIVGCSCQLVAERFRNAQWKVVFTLKGKQIGKAEFESIYGQLPAIGLHSDGERVKVISDAKKPC